MRSWQMGNSFLRVRDTDVRLSDYMAIEKREAKNCIPRQNQEYVLHVGFNVIGSSTYTNNYLSEIIREFNETVPLGFRCRNASYGNLCPGGADTVLQMVDGSSSQRAIGGDMVPTHLAGMSFQFINYVPNVTKEYNADICEQLGITVPEDYVAIAAE